MRIFLHRLWLVCGRRLVGQRRRVEREAAGVSRIGVARGDGYIRKKGMIPGVWLELEVMGICCETAKKVPDDWFFVRHGKRVYDRSRYQLDYRTLRCATMPS